MAISSVFINNRTQAVRLPVELRLPEGVRKVEVRARGNERIISPVGQTELFHGAEKSTRVSDNLVAIEDFCSRLEVLPYGAKAAQHHGTIRASLEKPGSRLASTICTSPPMRAARGSLG